ncbi:amino acid/amide ABC transporter substrate-binding protein, HAAT family [Paracoccus solventivorans]|uniref:Amino acid/amide ABC transporter substrate-binding protein, HAAT family n=1 Tax=Paracoccus solventivorans TaxID=53463 RepID=A0A1M7ISE8_9RHOB|nr:ABC transporter substrate-binding protein [Paracoccus solventivorans]SHM43650.1 amino acid/amide ABC transporter substrate-binding protein, HAAT family [Paracoccus solventivorans]
MKLAAAALSAAALSAAAGAAWAQDTVKIGALMIDSGPLAAFYQYSVAGLETAVVEINEAGGINGRPVELVSMTYSGTPEAALQTATRLVKNDKVAAVTGMIPTAVALAIAGRATALDTIIIDPLSAAGTRCNQNYFRVKASSEMLGATYKAFLQQNPLESWDIIAGDTTSGHDNAESFAEDVQELGGEVRKQLFTPVPTPDFGTYITQLNQEPAKGLLAIVYGADGVTFAKQQQQFGLLDKYEVVLGNNFAIPAVLPAMGEAALGVIQNVTYVPQVEGDGPRKFADAFEKIAGHEPDDVAFDMYTSMIALAQAMNKAGTQESAAVSKALEGLVIDSPVGPLEIRAEDHQMTRPYIFAEVVAAAPDSGKTVDYQIKSIIPAADYMPPPSPECTM